MLERLRRYRDLARFLYAQRVIGFDAPERPHMDEPSYVAFQSYLKTASFYLEFGSGGSTVEASRHGIKTVCVESDRFYARIVRTKIGKDHDTVILDAKIGETEAWGMPIQKRRTPARVKKWMNYTRIPFDYIAGTGLFPDFVLIDGRFRTACALETARQAFMRGKYPKLMFDDYQDRPYYHMVEEFLGSPQMIGRSALFDLAVGPKLAAITPEIVAAAHSDLD